jgi:uncharacterized protein YggT (Ycf19 family)
MTYPNEPGDVNAPVNAPVNAGYDGPVVAPASPLAPIRRAIWLLFGIVVGLIAIRIIFLALGANEGNVIVDFVYAITEPFVAPFRGIFSIEQVRPVGESRIDLAAFTAIIGWTLIAMVIIAILRIPDRTAV